MQYRSDDNNSEETLPSSSAVTEPQGAWQKTFWTITSGQFMSQIGSSAVSFALVWWIASSSGSAVLLGLAGLIGFLPTALLGAFAGVVADRYNRKVVCIAADMTVGIVSAAYALLLLAFDLPLWSVFVVLLLRGSVVTFQQPAYMALTPQYVPTEALLKANGLGQLVTSTSYILGPVVGAALYASFSLPVVLVSDLTGAIFACTLMAVAKVPPLARDASGFPISASAETPSKTGLATEIKAGIGVFRQDRPLLLMLIIQTLFLVFYVPLSSFYPLMTSDYFGLSAWHGSAVEASFAFGMLVASLLFGSVIAIKKKHLLVSYLGFVGCDITCIVCGAAPPTMTGWIVFAVSCGLMGAAGMVQGIPLTTYMQSAINPQLMGRAFSLIQMSAAFATPVGLLIGAPLAEVLGVNTWFLVSGIFITLLAIAGIIGNHRLELRQKGSGNLAGAR